MSGKKNLRNEDDLLEYMEENPKSVRWRNVEWLLNRQGWKQLKRKCKGADVGYSNALLKPFDEKMRAGSQAPYSIISFGKPHSGKDSVNPRDIERNLDRLKRVAELRKEPEDHDETE
ncbi:MAG: hypothetical protein JW941_04735 [Candidatus Coatesbacteria bacterium]|nr:hypothetical protein [Candidatus Coatesbacteria bacterium]